MTTMEMKGTNVLGLKFALKILYGSIVVENADLIPPKFRQISANLLTAVLQTIDTPGLLACTKSLFIIGASMTLNLDTLTCL